MLRIGEVIKIKVVESDFMCEGCMFDHNSVNCIGITSILGECDRIIRPDGKSIVFVRED